MRTDRKRLTSAIQRIAREDPEIRELLDDFRNSGGKPSTSATTGSGAEDRQTCCDGSSTGNANPGSGTRDPSDGGQEGLGDDPADIGDMGGGSLVGVKDCATDTPICFEGSDWIPPDGWNEPTEPPPDEGYEEGFYTYIAPGEQFVAASPRQTITLQLENQFSGCSIQNLTLDCGGWGDSTMNCTGNFETECGDGSGNSYFLTERTISRSGCAGSTYESDTACTEVPISETQWPEDGCINLANKNGKLVASKYDPEAQGSAYLKGVDYIELCDDFGNSFELRAGASGGWKTISSQNPGDGYLYNSNGEQIARISGSEFSDPNV